MALQTRRMRRNAVMLSIQHVADVASIAAVIDETCAVRQRFETNMVLAEELDNRFVQ